MRTSTVERSVRLRQPPETVWPFIVTPENFPKYVAGYRSGETLSRQTEGIGLRCRWRSVTLGLALESEEEVVEWDPPRRIVFRGKMAPVSFRSAMLLEPAQDGTHLTVRIRYWWPVPLLGAALCELAVKPLLRRSVRRSLRNLRDWDAACLGGE